VLVKKLSTRVLKEFARKLPIDFALRDILLSEKDELTPEEAVMKGELWIKLLERDIAMMEKGKWVPPLFRLKNR